MKKKVFTLIVVIFICQINIYSQDVEHIFSRFKEKTKITGGFSTSQIIYGMNGIEQRKNPYTYFLTANVNLAIWGWNLPFNMSYSNEQFQYTYPTFKILPFNQYGIAPYYNWIKIYLGYNSMSFSPYSMNGRTFYGAGIELSPGIFNFSAMYGKIQNAVDTDSVNTIPAYKRMAYAVKFGVKKNGDFIDLILFAAIDDTNSLKFHYENTEVLPMQNLVFNVNAAKVFFKSITLALEFANSGLTRDINKSTNSHDIPFIFNQTNFIFTNRISTTYRKAFKTNLSYTQKLYSIGVCYERVDPDYQSLGAYYFTNDIENLTINGTIKLFSNKMNLSGNIGAQRNDLEKDKISQNKRMVASINSSFTFSSKYNMSISYSNFSSYTFVKNQFEDINQPNSYQNLDTLNYTQLTQSANLSSSILIGNENDKNTKKNLNVNINYQKASDNQSTGNSNGGASFYNGNISFMYTKIPSSISLSTGLALNYNLSNTTNLLTIGPSLSAAKGLLKNKLKVVLSSSFCSMISDNTITSQVLSFRLNSAYSIKKKHNFSLSVITLNRFRNKQLTTPKFFEFTGTLNYSFNF